MRTLWCWPKSSVAVCTSFSKWNKIHTEINCCVLIFLINNVSEDCKASDHLLLVPWSRFFWNKNQPITESIIDTRVGMEFRIQTKLYPQQDVFKDHIKGYDMTSFHHSKVWPKGKWNGSIL